MTVADRERWDAKYAERDIPTVVEPPEWLVRHASDLPPGKALDIACGLGHAAIWLAQRGWDVTAVDISERGLKLARRFAEQQRVAINFVAADLDDIDLGWNEYDLVTVFRFLDRGSLPSRIIRALRPGGRVLYETFLSGNQAPLDNRPQNPAFLLKSGELPWLLAGLQMLEYAETPTPNPTARYLGQLSLSS